MGLDAVHGLLPLAGGEKDGTQADLARTGDVTEHVVADEDDVLRGQVHALQGQVEDAGIGLAIAEIAGDDEREKVAGKPHLPQFGLGPGRLGVGDGGEAVALPESVQDLAHIGIEFQTIHGNTPVHFGQEMGQHGQLGFRDGKVAAFGLLAQVFPPDADHVEFGVLLAALATLIFENTEIGLAHLVAIGINTVIFYEMADGPVDLLVALVGIDVNKRPVDVENDALDVHSAPSRMLEASRTSRAR